MIGKFGLTFLQIARSSSWQEHTELFRAHFTALFRNSLDREFERNGRYKLMIETFFMMLNETERIKMGHNASIFLHDATFLGTCFCIPVSHT